MIFTERTIKIANDVCKIDNPIVLYRGDYNVEIRFTIIECPYKYSTKNSSNIIETVDASYGQLVIKVPNDGLPIFSDIVETNEGSVVFTISGEMIDESIEVGDYTFQIRLFDANKESRATIPPIENGISIREPIAFEDVTTTNEVGEATVGYALTTAATNEDAFDARGNYNKTTWGTGDRITTSKLNKIEAGIDGVNRKVASGGTGGNNASDITITDTSNYFTSTNVEGALQEAGSQINDIKNDMQNVGNPTDEQVQNAINTAIENGTLQSIAGTTISIGSTIPINGEEYWYDTSGNTSDTPLGGGETTIYTITNTLTNCTTNNSVTSVNANSSYTATITANSGYTLGAITITMGGTDITSSAVSGNVITISSITGNVVITCTATATPSGGETTSFSNIFDTYFTVPVDTTTLATSNTLYADFYNASNGTVYFAVYTKSTQYGIIDKMQIAYADGSSPYLVWKKLSGTMIQNGYSSSSGYTIMQYTLVDPSLVSTSFTPNLSIKLGLQEMLDNPIYMSFEEITEASLGGE